jgi:N-acetylglucosamine-6-sulfatase
MLERVFFSRARAVPVLVLLASLLAGVPSVRAALPPTRPNILLIVSDDQSRTIFSRTTMPAVYGRIIDQGVNFNRGYVVSSNCCPSRSEILTGLYEHHTGVDDNNIVLKRPTIVEAVDSLGYRTMLAGKYLNSSPCTPRPEFDHWVCASKTSTGYKLKDPVLNVNGTNTAFTGYQTDILANFAVNFIQGTPADQPFFIQYSPTSPHLPADDPRYKTLFPFPGTPYRPPSFNEDTFATGKPKYLQRGPLTSDEISKIDWQHLAMTRATRSLDDGIATILNGLGSRAQETVVVYVSDNGWLYGEHRRWAKQTPYEEAVRVPFAIRYPPLVPTTAPFTSGALVQNIDITPTIAAVLGIPWGADGKSLVPLLNRSVSAVRTGALLERCVGVHLTKPPPDNVCDTNLAGTSLTVGPPYYGVVTNRYKYIEYLNGERELYDLLNNPYEIQNSAGDPAYAGVRADLDAKLDALKAPPPVETTIVSGPSGTVSGSTFTFRYFSQSRFATYSCRLDRNGVVGTWSSCNGQTKTVGPLTSASYVFRVRGTNEKGVTDPTPATRSFTVT